MKRAFFVLLLVGFLLHPLRASGHPAIPGMPDHHAGEKSDLKATKSKQAEEEKLPSEKAKEAIEKLKKVPTQIREGLGAAAEKLRETLGIGTQPPKKAKAEPELPARKSEDGEAPRYTAKGRDPFRPITLKRQVTRKPRENLSPLERYEIGQLKLVGVIWDIKEPKAVVEDGAGLGYIIKVGTPIGSNEGKVKEIRTNEVVIVETYTDFYGNRKNREVNLRLPE